MTRLVGMDLSLSGKWRRYKSLLLISISLFGSGVMVWHLVEQGVGLSAMGPERGVDLNRMSRDRIKGVSIVWRVYEKPGGSTIKTRFAELQVEHGELGLFRTSLYRIVKFQEMEIEFYHYDTKDVERIGSSVEFQNVFMAHCFGETEGSFMDVLMEKISRLSTHIIDMRDTSEIRINDFLYSFYDNDREVLRVESKRALLSYRSSDMLLRGHAILTNADGNKLEANRIRWDIRKGQFIVEGRYVSTHDGVARPGEGIVVDGELKTVEAEYVQRGTKEDKRWARNL